jgi:hypothetical protein
MTTPIDPRLGDYVPIEDFAKMVNRSRRTVSKMIAQANGLPHLRFGPETHIPLAEAKEWFAKRITRQNPKRERA